MKRSCREAAWPGLQLDQLIDMMTQAAVPAAPGTLPGGPRECREVTVKGSVVIRVATETRTERGLKPR
jgi:hypothetical protein